MSVDFDLSGLQEYVTYEDVEKDGIWFKDVFPGGLELKLRRAGGANRRYTHALLAATKPYKNRRGGLEGLPPEMSDKIMRDVVSRTVVADWRGVRDSSGKDVPCTPENVNAFFSALPDLFADVLKLASSPSMYGEDAIAEAAETLGEG